MAQRMSLAVEAEGRGLDGDKLEVQHIANESQGEGVGVARLEPASVASERRGGRFRSSKARSKTASSSLRSPHSGSERGTWLGRKAAGPASAQSSPGFGVAFMPQYSITPLWDPVETGASGIDASEASGVLRGAPLLGDLKGGACR